MAKPPVRRIPSDDCVVLFSGEEYHPHEGEWVEIVGKSTVAEMQVYWGLRAQANEPDDDDLPEELPANASEDLRKAFAERAIRDNTLASDRFDTLADLIARHIVGWSWTNERGDALPQPEGPDSIKALHSEEVLYLMGVIQSGGIGADRGNASKPSANISARTGRNPTRRG